ncbi:MAG: phosphatidate cytidylyltransferase [Traorella sp.]
MKTRIITMFAILAVVIPCLVLGGIFSEALILFIVSVGTYEYVKLANLEKSNLLTFILILLEFIGLYLPHDLIFPYIGIVYLLLLALPVFKEYFTPQVSFLCITFSTFFILVGNAFQEIYALSQLNIALIILVTYACDSFAYLVGRFFGKHKLNERVSPKKTIEGSIGGWVFGLVFALLFWKFFMAEEEFMLALLAGIFLPIFGQIGDLAFSAIKRYFGIKDYGNLLPGHGGILDRVDSLLFNLVCFYFIMMWVIL